MEYKFNSYQTTITDELLESLPREVKMDLLTYIESIPFINWLLQPEDVRGYAKDKKRYKNPNEEDENDLIEDPNGRIKADLTKPHILEDMDYFRERALFFDKYGKYTDITPNPNPKSDYAEFWREEVRRWKDGYVRPSDGEWIPGGLYFYWNYCPIWIVEEETSDAAKKIGKRTKGQRRREFPYPYLGDYLFYHYIQQAIDAGKHGKGLKTRGIGAEQPNSEIIKTPNGDKTVGDVRTGDYLIDIEGKPTKVLEIFPQGLKDVYEITLRDGRKVRCGINHLWYVKDFSKKRTRPVKLSEMIEKGLTWKINKGKNVAFKYKIPKLSPVEYSEKIYKIHPYVLGALLGDGTLNRTNIKIATDDIEIIEEFQKLLPEYNFVKDPSNNNYAIIDPRRFEKNDYNSEYKNSQYGINKLKRDIEAIGLNVKCYDKFIPETYLQGSIEQRLELLKGLMDSDGSVNSEGNCEFSNSNYKLISQVATLCRSLGIKARLGLGRSPIEKEIRGKKCDIQQEYRLYINTNEIIFKLPRKIKRCRIKKTFNEYPIINIEKLNYQEESTCFLVDNSTHTYLTGDYIPTHNSFKFGSYSPRNMQVYPGSGNPNFHLASDKTYLKGDKGIWGKIIDCLDWLATHTPLPKLRLTDKKEGLELQLGYVDKYGIRKGLLSSVYGISVKDDPDKARGIRGPLIHYEEDGVYPNLESNWNINRNATEEGGVTYGFMMAFGTGGTEGADFEGSEKLFYHPNAYNIYGIPNVFDLNSKGESECGFFWGAYLNRKNCYCLKTGEPDIIKSLIEVLYDRWHVKQNSSDTKAITQKKAELCITPQDAVMRIDGTVFPVSDLKERIADIMPKIQQFTKGHYYGELYQNAEGDIKWKLKEEVKYKIIRDFPIKDNKDKAGGIEIFQQPIRKNGQIETYRYIAGCDPFDDDHSTTDSLGSCFVMDSFTETIVAEYTGRPDSTTFYENCLRLLKYYNAIANYECDKKGLYAHFYNRNALHLLCDNPEILQEKSLANNKGNFGNKKKGTQSNTRINQWARRLQAEWLVKTAYGEEETGIMNLQKVRSVGYLKEAAAWHPDLNADRISSMGMLMILYQDTLKIEKRSTSDEKKGLLHNDEFFKRHAKGVNVEMAIN